MKPTPLTLDHIHYKSQDFNETKKFYIKVMEATDLGLVDLGPKESRKPNLQLKLAGTNLLFVQDESASTKPTDECGFPCNVPPWSKRHGVYHIALLVDNCKEATDYFSSRAKEVYGPEYKAVAIEPFDAGDNITASFLYAPDGMAIELKENRK